MLPQFIFLSQLRNNQIQWILAKNVFVKSRNHPIFGFFEVLNISMIIRQGWALISVRGVIHAHLHTKLERHLLP